MVSDKNSTNSNRRISLEKLVQLVTNLPATIIEFKGSIITIITWLVVAQISGYSLISIIWSIIKLILYPLNLLLFNTKFSSIDVPEIFILLVPLVIITTVGFFVIISTED